MQTFLPYDDFSRSAACLDRQRLGKQRVETLQIVKAILDPDYGWQNHPAVLMWRVHLPTLVRYQVAVCREWTGRGYKDTCLDKTLDLVLGARQELLTAPVPLWLGNPALHRSHRSNLLRKFSDHYAPLFEDGLPDDLEYIWPVAR